ncbi:23491_t:CDS:2, partial [Gigaspora margarita]
IKDVNERLAEANLIPEEMAERSKKIVIQIVEWQMSFDRKLKSANRSKGTFGD